MNNFVKLAREFKNRPRGGQVDYHQIVWGAYMRTTTFWTIAFSLTAGLFVASVSMTAKKMNKQFLNLDGKKPPGYTHVVVSPAGRMIFVSGLGGSRPDGSLPPDFSSQATNTFENLKRALALAGATFKDVVKINYFATDLVNTAELRRIRAGYLDMEHPPASTLVQAGLSKGTLLEVELVAVVPE